MNSLRRRNLADLIALVLPTAFVTAGCAMCCGPYDYHYPGYGGKIQRADPVNGRVGSVFSDPNMAGMGPLADSNIVPPVADELPAENILPGELPAPRDQSAPPAAAGERETMNQWRQSPPNSPIGYR